MGVWMEDEGKKLFQIPLHSAFLFMFSKLFVVPLIMVGLAKALGLNDEAGRAAVLIAALPISMASFSLAGHYKIGHATLSANVVLGTALMLPTILIWDIVMDKLDIFPIIVDKLMNTIV
jgi:predicted permease